MISTNVFAMPIKYFSEQELQECESKQEYLIKQKQLEFLSKENKPFVGFQFTSLFLKELKINEQVLE